MARTKPAAAAARGAEDSDLKARQREMWALGDYHKFARTSTWSFGPELVAACGVSAGQRVLDVAAGSGNVAIRAAEAGARVVASDLTPENFQAGRREARARGVQLEWVEADAEVLPFRDGEFDVVTSAVGAIFAPNHRRVADELVRVCRAGGVIGMITIIPSGVVLDLFETIERYTRSPLFRLLSPLRWGCEDHVRKLFGDRVEWLTLKRSHLVMGQFADAHEFIDYFSTSHPMMVWLHRELAAEPDQAAALDRDVMEVARRWMSVRRSGEQVDDGEYLLFVARKKPLAAG